MRYISSLFFIFLIQLSYSKITPFIPKYRLENLKAFINSKNLYYFNNAKGEFVMNKGFKSFPLVKGIVGQTNYNAFLSKDYSKILIEEISDYLSIMNIRKPNNIWLASVGAKKATKIGKGVNPQFHLGTQWISFYDPEQRILSVVNTATKEIFRKVRIRVFGNSYYIPEVSMDSNLNLIYSQINPKLEQEVIISSKKKKRILLKSTTKQSDFRICYLKGKNYIKEALLYSKEKKSSVSIYSINNNKAKRLYSSKGYSLGGIYCIEKSNKIAFTKRKLFLSKETPLSYDLIFFNPQTQSEKIEKSFMGDLSLFQNGNELLMSYDSKVFIYND